MLVRAMNPEDLDIKSNPLTMTQLNKYSRREYNYYFEMFCEALSRIEGNDAVAEVKIGDADVNNFVTQKSIYQIPEVGEFNSRLFNASRGL